MAPKSGLRGWTVITGASEGLGVEFARIAARQGRDLILVARQADKLEKLADELRKVGKISVEVIPTDLRDPQAVELLWRRASARRRIDILVNNAGLGSHGPFGLADPARERASIEVNVLALTTLMQHAIPHMRAAGGGRILNVASVASFMPGPGMAVYHATKAYVLALSEAVAEELRGGNVSVTALCPGATATNFFRDAKMEQVRAASMTRLPTAESVAAAGWKAMLKGRRIKVTGLKNRLFAQAPRFTPRALLTRIVAGFLK